MNAKNNNQLTFDVVIATRNRVDALKDSIPLMLEQSRLPEQLIVVDASDNHTEVKSVVEKFSEKFPVKILVLYSKIANSSTQRNLGLELVSSSVVIFPDDDSMWHPGVAEAVMLAYETDVENLVGGVCCLEVTDSPIEKEKLQYKRSIKTILKTKIQPWRNKLERVLFPKPFNVHAYEKWKSLPAPPWLEEKNCVVVETMAGCRMSFRTSVIKKIRFDETLGAKVGYALHEDMDASLGVYNQNLNLVAALDAKIFHHKYPAPRAAKYDYGFCQIANQIYIVSKQTEKESKAFKCTISFLKYKILLYRLRAQDATYEGAKDALNACKHLLDIPKNELESEYVKICSKYIGNS